MQLRKKILSVILCLCLLTACMGDSILSALAAEQTGTVFGIDAGSYLSVRKNPSTKGELLDKLHNDDVVTILDTVTAENIKWYKITYQKENKTVNGYASSDYIRIQVSYKTDAEFEAYLTQQNFPEEYKKPLRQLFAQYPNWIFRAEHLSVTWREALAAESKTGLNTIQSPTSWKSMEKGAYDWHAGTYVSFDSGGWVSAVPELVAYYLDPRNFLTPEWVFQFEDLHYAPEQTIEGVQAILPSELDKHAADLIKASMETKVSAYFLATRMAQEGTHKNGLGTGTVPGYEGYYNFFDIGAYAHSYNSAVTNGAIYAKNKGWNTPYKCLLGSAEWIGKSYINLGQDTLYYQKFNVVNTKSGLYSQQYMTNVRAAADEGRIRYNKATATEKNGAITFVIPVYKNMPKAANPQPPKNNSNNNNFLKSITVKGHALTPTFDLYESSYSLHVGDADSITVEAVTHDKNAKLKGTGEIALYTGSNVLTLEVTAPSGLVRKYTLTITTTGGSEPPPSKVPVTSKEYLIGETITKVEPNTAYADFLAKLTAADGTLTVCSADGTVKTGGIIGTGDTVQLHRDDTLVKSCSVVIYGDVNGDGKITSTDLRIAQKDILKIAPLDKPYLTAADSGKDGKLTSTDLRITQKYILKMTTTLQ